MEESDPTGLTELVDTQLENLRARTKKQLSKDEAEDAYGDLLSTIGLVNSAWAAETSSGAAVDSVRASSGFYRAIGGGTDDGPPGSGSPGGSSGGGRSGSVEAIQPAPPILTKLKSWVAQIKDILHEVARAMNATSYTITVGFPWGVSIALTFDL